jgi:molybdopterin-binding protein
MASVAAKNRSNLFLAAPKDDIQPAPNTCGATRSDNMKVGARNRIIGKVTQIKKGSLMSIVHVDVSDPSKMASVMTIESLNELGLKKGDKVEVVVKVVNVLLIKS